MLNPIRFLAPILVLLLALTATAACGGDDDDDDDDAGDDDAADDDTTDDDASDDDTTDDDDDTGNECDEGFLSGTWVAEMVTLTLLGDGSFQAVGVNQEEYDVMGTYAVDGCEISFTDLGGNGACPDDQVGTYAFSVSETTLTTTPSADACAGRVTGMDGTVFDRES
jgi:hypothetical protein